MFYTFKQKMKIHRLHQLSKYIDETLNLFLVLKVINKKKI
jgi:hypothetical protein